jgi:DNA-binding MarR family transcriptional regulator
MEKRKFVHRTRSRDDARCVLVSLLPRGEEAVQEVARQRITELRAGGTALVDALEMLLKRTPESRRKKKTRGVTI